MFSVPGSDFLGDSNLIDVYIRYLRGKIDDDFDDKLIGTVRGVGRHGLSGQKRSVFAKAAYEETVKHLVNAAAFSEIDNMRGVTENILVGKQIPLGTGSVRLAIKKEDVQKARKS